MSNPAALCADDSGHAIFTRLRHPLGQGVLPIEPRPLPAAPAAASRAEHRAAPLVAPGPDASDLEHLAPSAASLLVRVWGKPAAAKALRALLLDGDGLVRRLPPALWSDLALLCRLHALAHPATGTAELPQVAQFPLIEIGYRHVVQRLVAAWGNVEAFALVHHNLVIDDRGGRSGWPAEVWDDLVLLQQIHDRVFGPLAEGRQPWNEFFLRQ